MQEGKVRHRARRLLPAISLPAPVLNVEATGPAGATATFSAPATDLNGNSIASLATPGSGTLFPLGQNTVVVTATDAVGSNTTTSFISERPGYDPAHDLSARNLTVEATGSGGAVVSFVVSGTDIVDGAVPVNSSPASGSLFPLGTTPVYAYGERMPRATLPPAHSMYS